jgi:phosphatidate cytidylyltransferase
MLLQRILTAVVGGSILLILIYFGGTFALLAALLLLLISALEIASIAGLRPVERILAAVSALASFYFFLMEAPAYAILFPLVILTFVRKDGKQSNFSVFALTIYTAFGYSRFYELSLPEKTLFPVMVLLATVWSLDTVSFFAGNYLGRIKIAPRISPNKTLEGAIAGIAAGTAAFVIAVEIAGYDTVLSQAIIKGVAYSVAAISGDLIESAFKRAYGVKDSGSILPGHGGVLDRFDSLLAVLVVSSFINF